MNRIISKLSRVLLCVALIALFAPMSARAEIASKSYVDSLAMPNGDDYLQKAGGTMTGEIAMGGNKIAGLGAPTDGDDATTKDYVDNLAAAGGGTIGGGSVPSWAALNGEDWADSGWGVKWVVDNGTYMVDGVGTCLSTDSRSGILPSTFGYGPNCWCRVEGINNTRVLGAWVFKHTESGGYEDCYATCASRCANCVRVGSSDGCSRAALFTAP
ncbi:MAG: hypothetical protein LBJ73_00690 [Rickettsiales bacterium]|nr:hypothetical protein [Rickettsiales bacterium]